MSDELKEEFLKYLDRAKQLMGDVPVGHYAKVNNRLIKKLNFKEFTERWSQYQAFRKSYKDSIDQGGTVNDAVVQLLDEHASELLIPSCTD